MQAHLYTDSTSITLRDLNNVIGFLNIAISHYHNIELNIINEPRVTFSEM